MTKTQKRIVMVLTTITALLGVALIALIYHIVTADTEHLVEPTEAPIHYVEIPVEPTATPATTPIPIVTIRVPELGQTPEVTSVPETCAPTPHITPTPDPAYVYMPTGVVTNTPYPTVPKGMAFTLSILGKTINVANNVEEDTLEETPGWLPTSVKPGKEGVCVVYGHRNRNHLLVLKDIEIGDEIDVIMPNGEIYTYVVDKTEILEADETVRIPTTESKQLMLMTCYPFYYSGHAPKKFVATCSLQRKR